MSQELAPFDGIATKLKDIFNLLLYGPGHHREVFKNRLVDELHTLGIEVISTSFGRGPEMVGIWGVFVQGQTGAKRHLIHLPTKMQPYGEEAFLAVMQHFREDPK